MRGKMIYAKKTHKFGMNVGVVGIPSTVWMTEGIYCCPVLEVTPEHHRCHIWMDARYCPSDDVVESNARTSLAV